ncbi:MAG TPA: SRPBCC domain-containing protein [Acidimicrobiales bacterium]|nr:SRPBCC domain-containing protein [Acidimicrobiales bacterium]
MRTTFPVTVPAEVWSRLSEPGAVAAALPGGRAVTADGDGTLSVVAEVAVASVAGLWSGTVTPVDADTIRISGAGTPGRLDLEVRASPDRRQLTVEGAVDGPLSTVGGAVLAAAARRLAEDLLANLADPATATTNPPVTHGGTGGDSAGAGPAIDTSRAAAGRSRRRLAARAGAGAGAVVVVVTVVRRWRRSPR